MGNTAKRSLALFLLALVVCALAWRLWPDGREAHRQQRNCDLFRVVALHRLADATRLLDEGADPNTQTPPLSTSQKAEWYYFNVLHRMKPPTWGQMDTMMPRWSALQLAVVGGDADMVSLLLSRGADVGYQDKTGKTALNQAKMGLNSSLTTPREAHNFRHIVVLLRAAEARKKAPNPQ